MTPTLRALTARLRELHAAWSHPDAGGEYVSLFYTGNLWWVAAVDVGVLVGWSDGHGREWIPGDGKPFDAVATARRLLAALRDHELAARHEARLRRKGAQTVLLNCWRST